jgi:hypothetical protein
MAIAGMHYTAMAAVSIVPDSHMASTAPAISADLLAIVVAIVAFIVSGLFLLVLVPDREADAGANGEPALLPGDDLAPAISGHSARPEGESPSIAASAAGGAVAASANGAEVAAQIPVQHDGATIQIPVDSVVAVHANAHYTYVFDGNDKYFCQLAIGDVEQRLDPHRFARVHRSHIINIERIVRLKRTGDNGVLELAGHESYSVPVSRSRLAWLRSQLAAAKAAQGLPSLGHSVQ